MERRPWSLRRRLIVSITGVVAVLLAVVGILSIVTLGTSVTSVVDMQLTSSLAALQHSIAKYQLIDAQPSDGPISTTTGFRPLVDFVGQAPGTVIALLQDGVLEDSALFTDSDATTVTPDVAAQLETSRSIGAEPSTISLAGLGNYRIIGVPDRSRFVVAAVPLATAEQATIQETITISLLALAALAVTVVAIAIVVRRTLRPLDRVVAVAAEVTHQRLDTGDSPILARLEPGDTDPRTELGKVGQALNQVLTHVDRALAVRVATDRTMRRFVTDASHELRTPLAAIQGYAELTRQSSAELPEETEYSLSRIEAESRRMGSLVSDLLLLARLDEGQDLQRDEVDLSELVVNAVSDANASALAHLWRHRVPPGAVIVIGDHERLHQMILNLLSNAAVHTPPGTTVGVSLRQVGESGQERAEIEISDDGPGIDPEMLPGLFDRFARGDKSRSRASGSTGLGLAIVLSIVEAHGGAIDVSSSNEGTTFTVSIPREPGHIGRSHDSQAYRTLPERLPQERSAPVAGATGTRPTE